MRFALVSREVYPFIGGGLSRYVTATAETLADVGEVTVFLPASHEERHEQLKSEASPLLPSGVRFVFVPEPGEDEIGSYYHSLHAWSARVYDALKAVYADGGPDVLEFPDYHGEGFVSIQARRALEPVFRSTFIAIRLYTTSELTSILNGHVSREFGTTVVHDLERYALRHADRILAPGGDVYGTYRRFYDDRLAPALQVRHPVLEGAEPSMDVAMADRADGSLELLFVGRLERRKGVQNLLRAVTALLGNWRLTLVGDDTRSAPLGTWMRYQLELMAAGDPRIAFHGPASPSEVAALMDATDVVVLPSLWECWPNVALEAFARSRPVLATPTGGYTELVQPGRSGWLTRDTSASALARSIGELLKAKDSAGALAESGGPLQTFVELTDRDEVRDRYVALAEEARRRARRSRAKRRPQRLVSVVIPYYQLPEYVEETLQSVFDQTYTELEVLVVNDGSFRDEDRDVLDDLAERYPIRVLTQQNSGLGAARNFGISQSRGSYVFPLDADDLVAPTFVERCVAILDEHAELAYVTSWSRFVDDAGVPIESDAAGYQPIGICKALEGLNVAGSAEAVFRKRVFERGLGYSVDLTSYEDWLHFRELAEAGYEGCIIPERLLSYRIRDASMVRTVALHEHGRLIEEIEAHLQEARTLWPSPSG